MLTNNLMRLVTEMSCRLVQYKEGCKKDLSNNIYLYLVHTTFSYCIMWHLHQSGYDPKYTMCYICLLSDSLDQHIYCEYITKHITHRLLTNNANTKRWWFPRCWQFYNVKLWLKFALIQTKCLLSNTTSYQIYLIYIKQW